MHLSRNRSALGLGLALSTLTVVPAPAALAQGSDASVWHSSVPAFPATELMPVGGSGQINGGFVLDGFFDPADNTALQLGLRAQKRFEGLLPQTGSVYFAETGTSVSGSGLVGATWNFDLHVDLGTLEEDLIPTDPASAETLSLESLFRDAGLLGLGQLQPLDLRDLTVELLFDRDPSGATDFETLDLNLFADAIADAFMTPAPTVRLFQTSQNLEFNFLETEVDFDPEIPGLYDFRLRVADGARELASVAIQVAVGDGLPADVADVEVTVTESEDPVVVDAAAVAFTHTVTVTNRSATTAAGSVVVSDALTLPAGVDLGATMATAGVVTGGAPALTWTVGTLAALASETLTLTLSVDPSAATGVDVIVDTAVATSETPDDNLANNTAMAATSIDCLDTDLDGVCDRDDNCPLIGNGDQADSDADGNGNACDLCLGDDTTGDGDLDGICDGTDFCVGDNATGDADGDGLCADRDCDDNDPTNLCLVFEDGFESGDLAKWSTTVGPGG